MKTWFFLIFFIPLFAFGQGDFETRYFTISARTLPEVDVLSDFSFNQVPFVKRSLDEFQMNENNFRSAVNMVAAIEKEESFLVRNVDLQSLQSEFGGLGDPSAYQSDGKTRVKNTVYKEVRGLDLMDPCPPFGICQRCAPYRVGRGY